MWFYFYLLFALTTAIVAMFDLFLPAMRAISDRNVLMVKYRTLTLFVFFVITLAMAPLIFLIYIKPSASIVFRDRLIEVMSEG